MRRWRSVLLRSFGRAWKWVLHPRVRRCDGTGPTEIRFSPPASQPPSGPRPWQTRAGQERAAVPGGRTAGQSAIGRYTRLPAAANSFDFWTMPSSISSGLPPWRRRMSWEIFMEQNLGPHMEQK